MTSFIFQIRQVGLIIPLTLVFVIGFGGVKNINSKDILQEGNDSLLGNYLSGRYAKSQRDVDKAARYYQKALNKDPGNEVILEQAFLLATSNGNWDAARLHANELVLKEPNHRIARIYLGIDAFKNSEYGRAETQFSAVGKGQIAELITSLAKAWTQVAKGRYKSARKSLNVKNAPEWAIFYRTYHQALIADLQGLNKYAAARYSTLFKRDPRSLRVAIAYSRHLARRGLRKQSRSVLQRHISLTREHPVSIALLKQIISGKKIQRLIRSPNQGMAEVFYGLGEALTAEGGIDFGIIYLKLALVLQPDFPLIHNTLGQVYEQSDKYDLAINAYNQITQSSAIWKQVQIRKAFVLNAADRLDESRSLLLSLAKENPKDMLPLDSLGNILRSRMNYDEAEKYYSQSISLIKNPKKEHWSQYYSRGVCYDRLKKWDKAEADFKMALKLDVNQPLVLNYLGYSWVDQSRNLNEAMSLIRKAVRIRPKDGYFVDSLGWAYYRLGDYKSAVKQLETAVLLLPEDPVINDHLGDAFWRVGRRLEARYQWILSLSLKPTEDVVKVINEKLASGLKEEPETKAAQVKNEKVEK